MLLGGVSNIVGATNCATRLRVEVVDPSIADNATFVAAGAKGLIVTGKTAQVIIGISVPASKSILTRSWASSRDLCPPPRPPCRQPNPQARRYLLFDIDGTLAWQDPRLAQDLPEDRAGPLPYPTRRFRRQSASLSPTATWPLSARDAP
ncbi:MAG: PTS transporter subunit EIIB [Collinsella sp.]